MRSRNSEVYEEIEDVASLRVNIWVNRIISHLELLNAEKKQGDQPELMCNNCDSKEAAKAKCFDCGTFMCNACMAAHQRIVSLKDHQLMTLEDIKKTGVPIIDKLMFCKKHKGEVQKLFCKTCEELICRDCTIIDHKDHDACFIVDIAKEHEGKLRKEIKMASATKEKIEAGLKSVKAMQQLVKKNSADIQKYIDDVINQHIQALEEKRNNLKQESRDIAATEMKNLTAQEDGLAMHMTGLKSAIEFTENVLSKGSNSEVLSISKQILSRLSQLSSKPFDREVNDEDPQVLEVDKEMLSDGILKFAKVIGRAAIDPGQCEIENVASLKVNIWVNRIISHLELFKAEKKQADQPELMCNNCDSKEAAKAKCFDCGKFMCNACMAAHQRIVTLKDHQLMTLEDIKRTGVPIIDKLMFCKKHKGEVQKLFCKTCEELICRDCTIIDHKDHDICFIVDIAKEHKEKLTREIKMASATKEKIEAGLKTVKAMQTRVQKNAANIEKRIDDVINQHIQALEKNRINLKQKSRGFAATKMKNLTAQEDGLAMHMTGLKSAIEFTENVLSKGNLQKKAVFHGKTVVDKRDKMAAD
ncbi:hypothetical protein QZH41_001313 [Actinostola sp. cb2023]|nr:hypothetical protein QZH41_001313 [Actinostola sp. cb2023]